MNLASSVDRAEAPLFADGLGERVVAADATSGELLQILRLRPALTAVPSFEFALRERTARLMNFRHAYYARVRRVDRVQANGSLAIVSDHVEGTRLSEILRVAQERDIQLDTNAALCLIRQLVPAVALLHENARDASHGLIAPERLVVTPHARLVIVEHVAGSAIEQLQYGRDRLWQELRIAMPSSAGISRFDHRADVNGVGITALSLVLGRPLTADEFPHAIPALLMHARERTALGEERPLSNAFRNWLGRTLQLDVRRSFASAPEALAALEETLASDSSYLPAPVALESFLSQYNDAVLEPLAPSIGAPAQPVPMPSAAVLVPAPVPVAVPSTPVPVAVAIAPAALAPTVREMAVQREQAKAGSDIQALPTIAELIPVSDLQVPAESRASELARVFDSAVDDPDQRDDEEQADQPYDRLSEFAAPGDETDDDAEPFAAEMSEAGRGNPASGSRARLAAMIVGGLVLTAGGVFAARSLVGGKAAEPALGTLIVQSNPAGVEVFVDGQSRGMTPSRLSLQAGSHILELRGNGVPRVIPFELQAGGQVDKYLEFRDTPLTGELVVHSQPAGAKVLIDGTLKGVAPITVQGLAPGDHEVMLQNGTVNSRHVVKILAGTTASLVAPIAEAAAAAEGPVSGWLSVQAPVAIEIREDGQLLGTTETDRVMMAAGKHVLEFVNPALGFRETRTVQVAPGKVAALTIVMPKGSVNLNATPWAEVWMDGRRIGDTPIGNLEVPIGPHEFVFRHPEFGEKKHAVAVTTGAPVRISAVMK
jgi:hypothetical protein